MKNVISTTNAGKRHYGPNHWFWAVWIDVHPHAPWNKCDPSVSGFCPSKATARRASWDALGKRLPEGAMLERTRRDGDLVPVVAPEEGR